MGFDMKLPYRNDCIVIQEFTIYASGAVFFDQILVFKNEEAADKYLNEMWYDRYGERNIKENRDNGGIVHERYYYVEIHEMGLQNNNDLSRRCFTANYCPIIKKSDLI